MVKRDFIFIDEAGEPGEATPYYIGSSKNFMGANPAYRN